MKLAALILLAALSGCAHFDNEVYPGPKDSAIFVSWYYNVGIATRAKIVKADVPAAAKAASAP